MMKAIAQNLLIFCAFAVVAVAVNLWPAQHFLASGGSFEEGYVYPNPAPPELDRALAILASTGLLGLVLICFGLAWSFLKAWKPFAISLGIGVVVCGALLVCFLLDIGKAWIPIAFLVLVPLGIISLVYSAFLSLKNNLILLTLLRLIGATSLAILITVLFPVIVVAAGLYLKFNRGLKFSEVWSESPELYNFLMVNIYPIFFSIIPELRSVMREGAQEKKLRKKTPAPVYTGQLDVSKLRVGDVILTGVDSWNVAVPIQASNILSSPKQKEERHWCHAAMYVGDGKVIEAQTGGDDPERQGVILTGMDYFFTRGQALRVFRHLYISDEELKTAVAFCRSKQADNCQYDTWGVSFYGLAALIPPMLSGWLSSPFAERFFNVKDAYFCSELVAEAYLEAGHDVFKRSAWRVKPLDFAYTPVFREITSELGFVRTPVGGAAVV